MKSKIQNFRTKTIALATFCIVFLSLFTVSCSKPENGKDGAAGTANVFYSNWAPVTFTGSGTLFGDILAPKLTQDILDRGIILIYFKISGSSIASVPTSNSLGYITSALSVGNISLKTTYNLLSSTDFRYIIIPGGVSISGKMLQTDYSKMSYSQVCQSLQITE
jgi:hypothetical protein